MTFLITLIFETPYFLKYAFFVDSHASQWRTNQKIKWLDKMFVQKSIFPMPYKRGHTKVAIANLQQPCLVLNDIVPCFRRIE